MFRRIVMTVCLIVSGFATALHAADLGSLANVIERTSHRASSTDPTGGNNDNVMSFAPGETHVMLDTDGPGQITHLWLTVSSFPNHMTDLRDLVICMTWEHAAVPAVEVPLGDFFAMGHGRTYKVQSLPVNVGANHRAMNCYWPMPFHKHARIEIRNNGNRSLRRIYYNIDYELGPIPDSAALFHAEFRRDKELRTQEHVNTTGQDNYVIMETTGRGQYVGCALFVDAAPGGWWGEGDEMIFIDHSERPVIIGTGSEDYFCNAWGYKEAFSYAYYGAPLLEEQPDKSYLTTVYRWHIPDPVRFDEHIRVTIEHLFSAGVVNDYSSVAYWYQTEPIRRRDALPVAENNHPRTEAPSSAETPLDIDGTELEPVLRSQGINARAMTVGLGDGYKNGGILQIDALRESITIPVRVNQHGPLRVRLKPVNHLIDAPLRIGVEGSEPVSVEKHDGHERDTPYIDLGTTTARDGKVNIIIFASGRCGIDHLRIEPAE